MKAVGETDVIVISRMARGQMVSTITFIYTDTYSNRSHIHQLATLGPRSARRIAPRELSGFGWLLTEARRSGRATYRVRILRESFDSAGSSLRHIPERPTYTLSSAFSMAEELRKTC